MRKSYKSPRQIKPIEKDLLDDLEDSDAELDDEDFNFEDDDLDNE